MSAFGPLRAGLTVSTLPANDLYRLRTRARSRQLSSQNVSDHLCMRQPIVARVIVSGCAEWRRAAQALFRTHFDFKRKSTRSNGARGESQRWEQSLPVSSSFHLLGLSGAVTHHCSDYRCHGGSVDDHRCPGRHPSLAWLLKKLELHGTWLVPSEDSIRRRRAWEVWEGGWSWRLAS